MNSIDLVIAITILLIIAASATTISHRLKIPFSVFMVIIGFILASLARAKVPTFHFFTHFKATPDLIIYVCLPALIFESAFALNARQLKSNLLPILTLAIPGLLLSTFTIGGLVWLLTPLSFPVGLLLGSILSATDPVAVIALFKKLGTPKRLTVLVEGESLFNDATAIVTANVIAAIILSGTFTLATLSHAGIHFASEFFGGIAVGLVISFAIGLLIGLVDNDLIIEISAAVILAYLSFLVAQKVFHVSGVMATLTAGVMMGGWGYTKISTPVMETLKTFLDYIGSVANALVFFLIGVSIHLEHIGATLLTLGVVILAMLVSRALVVFGLIPLIGKFPKTQPIDRRYQTVMWWGGLRGAIALAIVLGFNKYPEFRPLEPLVAGAVLFTLIVPALSLEKIVRWLKLNKPPLSDELSKVEGQLEAEQSSLALIPELQKSGLFSMKIAQALENTCTTHINTTEAVLTDLQTEVKRQHKSQKLLWMNCLAIEKKLYYDYFSEGHLTEKAYRSLAHTLELQMDSVRHTDTLSDTLRPTFWRHFVKKSSAWLENIPGTTTLFRRLRGAKIIEFYEEYWGRHQGTLAVLQYLDKLSQTEKELTDAIQTIQEKFITWRDQTREELDTIAEQFPTLVADMQIRLGERLMLHAREKMIHAQVREGILPEGVAEELLKVLAAKIWQLRKPKTVSLDIDLFNMLKKIPLFADLPDEEIKRIQKFLKPNRVDINTDIIQQDDEGDSLFLIMHGVVRVIRTDEGTEKALATLLAGDFFGEIVLLHGGKRTATCRAMSPCVLFELSKKDFDEVIQICPNLRIAAEQAVQERTA